MAGRKSIGKKTSQKKKPVTSSSKAGLTFSVSRTRRAIRNAKVADRITASLSVYETAVLEYICAEILELAGNAARENKTTRISPRHVQLAVRNDEELNRLYRNTTISRGGVIPGIRPELLKKKE